MDSKLLFSCIILFVCVFKEGCTSEIAAGHENYNKEYYNKIIEDVKKAGARWEAGHNFEDDEEFRHLLGSLDPLKDLAPKPKPKHECIHTQMNNAAADPKVGHAKGHTHSFNGLKEWKHCKSVRRVWNQGRCASDWVIAPVAAFTDRLCIASNGTFQDIISPETPLACCKSCGWGCKKGYPSAVNEYLVRKGAVTGAEFGSKKGCQPYSVWPSKHAKYFQRVYAQTPKCQRQCTNEKYKKRFYQDIIKAKRAFSYTCPYCCASELMRHGPVTATMIVYEDFIAYKKGVYHHVTGKPIGKLTVKLVGFDDEDPENKYWIAINSWGKKWGNNGQFLIRRTVDECQIEGSMHGVYVYSDADESESSSSSEEEDDFNNNEE